MKGIDLLTECRKSAEFKIIPIILVTGERDQDLIIKAAMAGVTDYLIKPLSDLRLKQKIERVYQKLRSVKKVA